MAEAKVHLIHCSYHKCLTVYFRRVMDAMLNRCLPWSGGYRHFNSHLDEFLSGFRDHSVASVNNRALDPSQLGRFRLTRFLRDPRDLVISGYFYHRRGAEPWTTMASPIDEDWTFANGVVPEEVHAAGGSFADYLQSVPEEEGLLAEMAFRTHHFESMIRWPTDHPDILTQRYEDVVGNEVAAFRRIFEHYGMSFPVRQLGAFFARRHAQGRGRTKATTDPHIRDPSAGQWRRHFNPRLRRTFERRFPGLIRQLGYPED